MFAKVAEEFEKYIEEVRLGTEMVTSLNPMQKSAVDILLIRGNNAQESETELYRQDYEKKIKGKTEHIQRVTRDMGGMFGQLSLGEDFEDLAKVVGLLHDVGRYEQLAFTSTFVDGDSYSKYPDFTKYGNHAEHGAGLLKNGLFDRFGIMSFYQSLIYNSVYYHACNEFPEHLNKRLPDELFEGKSLNSAMIKQPDLVNSLYAQAIKDVDKFDLFNQVLIGNIPIVRKDFGLDFLEGDTVEDFSKVWGINPETLREYNKISNGEQMKPGSIIRIPTDLVPIENFTLPQDLVEMFKNGNLPPLKDLQARKDYSFLCAQVFRLSLLRNISFVSLLKDMRQKQMLEKTFNMYPVEYQEIMKPVFEYASDNLIDGKIEGLSKIYTK